MTVTENVTGSFVIGGYDTSRLDTSTTLHATMPSKQNNTLIVAVNANYLRDQRDASWIPPSNAPPPLFRIDSLLPQTWLAVEACKVFEATFGLVWNSELAYYILDANTRTLLLQQNPSVSFSIVDCVGSNPIFKKIASFYSAFDLQLTSPIVNETMYYFSLRRATSPL